MRRSSILKKMLIGLSLPIIFVLIFSGYLISSMVGKTVTEQAKQKLESDSMAAANQVSDFFTQYLSGSRQAACSYQMEEFIEKSEGKARLNTLDGYDEIKITLDKLAGIDTNNILASWVGDFDTSQITQSDGFNSEPGWDIAARPWYRVKETKTPVLTEPYIDASTGQLIVSAAAPILNNSGGEVSGALGYDIKLSQLIATMKNYKIGKQGFIILCTDSGQIIYHPNSELVQKNVTDIDWTDNIKQALQNGTVGSLDYTMEGVEYSGAVHVVKSCGWYVLSGIPRTEMMESYDMVVKTIIGIFLAGLMVLIVIIYLISRGISKPLKHLAIVAEQIAEGNLDIKVDVHSNDETGLVADAMDKTVNRLNQYIDYINEITGVLNQIADNNLIFDLKYDYAGEFAKVKNSLLRIKSTLTDTMRQIGETSNEVAAGSDHISAGAQALSQGATQQASSIQELAATISEISGQVKQNADDSTDADRLVSRVSEELMESNSGMQDLNMAMEDINRSSGEIGKIIKTIEDIAFQTNILALNAAVEAARAGKAGKGFAVVADEVGNLASKSAQAAKETTKLIEDSIHAVENGTKLARDAAETMLHVVESTQKVSDTITRISKATNIQADSISQVAVGVDQISGVVQTNSATAEESAAASEQLSGQAQILKELVDRFQLDDD